MSIIKGNSIQSLNGNTNVSIADLIDLRNTALVEGDVGAANGVAPLGSDGKVPVSYLSITGLANFTEGLSATNINATVPVVYLIPKNSATDVDVAIGPKGNGGLAAQAADGTKTYGNKRGINSVDWQMSRVSASKVASADYSVVSGGANNIASSYSATVGGGNSNTGGGNFSTIGGGSANTTLALYTTVGGGYNNTASATTSTISGGYSNNVSTTGQYGFIGGGISNSVTTSRAAVVTGGELNTAGADYSSVSGGYQANTRKLYGAESRANGLFAVAGDAQRSRVMLRTSITTTTTTSVLTSDAFPISSTNVHVLPFNSCFSFSATMVYRDNISGECASWLVTGLVKMGATLSTISLVGTPTITLISKTGNVTNATVGVGVNTTIGALTFTATSEASGAINSKIIADVQTVELVG